jgi:hypothetical protein
MDTGDSFDSRLLRWGGFVIVAFLLGSFVTGMRPPVNHRSSAPAVVQGQVAVPGAGTAAGGARKEGSPKSNMSSNPSEFASRPVSAGRS